MKRFSLLLLAVVLAVVLYAQESVYFVIKPTGAFELEGGGDFAVVEFPVKSAAELYAMVKSNVLSYYNAADEVMSESDGEMISIYAYDDKIWRVNSLGATGIYGGYYKLVFRFKDGKVRVDAPSISKELILCDGSFTNTIGIRSRVFLSNCAKKVCSGKSKKDAFKKVKLECVVNIPINYLLGITQQNEESSDSTDW